MYKKITHDIVEEHYDHPLAMEARGLIDKSKLSTVWPRPPYRGDFQNEFNNQFRRMNQDIRDCIKSEIAANPDLSFNTDKLLADISEMRSLFLSAYDTTTVNNALGYLTQFANTVASMLPTIKAGGDYSIMQSTAVNHLTNFLNTVLPPSGTMMQPQPNDTYAQHYVQALIDQATARLQQNWSADAAAEEAAITIATAGPIFTAPFNNAPSMADLIVQSVFRRFSEKFV